MMAVIGFVINPIAGMGGRVGLKGTDGVVEEARSRGAVPVAGERSLRTFKALLTSPELVNMRAKPLEVKWYTCAGDMGATVLEEAGIPADDIEVVYEPGADSTSAEDTGSACRKFLAKNVDLVFFCGGDGTARDVFTVIDGKVPMLGIPAGVKMHSGVFGVSPEGTALILSEYLDGKLSYADVEIMDQDEDAYRQGNWNLKLFGTVKTPYEPSYIQGSKLMMESASEDEVKSDIASFILEEVEAAPETLFILGPGGTLAAVGSALELETTLLGVDAVKGKELVGTDINEADLLKLLVKSTEAKLLVSPIGNQGFVFGRGNHQFSPEVIRKVGLDNIWILTTPAKLTRTPTLRVDTGDPELDKEMVEHKSYRIVIGYRMMRREGLVKEDSKP
jgi:predicted polyphosphate/ATP-dependent NAD kinase